MATRRRTVRRNPSDLTFIRAMLKQSQDGLMYALDEITKTTVWEEGEITKAQMAKFKKAYKAVMKALIATNDAKKYLA